MENYGNYQSSDYSGYDDLKLYPDESPLTTGIKGFVGAVVGAVPGILLWIILGKLGYIAVVCGILLAFGSAYGYNLMTKKGSLSPTVGIIICLGIVIVAVFMAEKIVWCWELTDAFNEQIPLWKAEIDSIIAGYGDTMSALEVQTLFDELMLEEYGFTEADFSACFYNFGDLLKKLDLKSDFTMSLVKSYICGAAGMGAAFKNFIK